MYVVGVLVVMGGADVWVSFWIVGLGAGVGRVFVGKRGGTGGRVAGDGDGLLVLGAKGVNVGAEAWRVQSRAFRVECRVL